MTTTDETQETEAVEAQEAAEGSGTPEDSGKSGSEAAKYRRRLRETEVERDQIAERLTTMQKAEVERLVADELTAPAGLWASGVELADLLDDAGNVDAEKVATAARDAVTELGLESRRAALLRGNVVPREGNSPTRTGGSGWSEAFDVR